MDFKVVARGDLQRERERERERERVVLLPQWMSRDMHIWHVTL